ncbi:MAG: hypothetical protein AAB932_04420, partial [Patescibacteria group bacterium]
MARCLSYPRTRLVRRRGRVGQSSTEIGRKPFYRRSGVAFNIIAHLPKEVAHDAIKKDTDIWLYFI